MTSAFSTDPGFAAVTDLVRAHFGLIFAAARSAEVEAGLRKVMAKIGIDDLTEFFDRLQAQTSLLDDLIAELTVGETYFFRDPGHFSFIRHEIVPQMRCLRGMDHVLRVWSAGCASGEEAYSLAILVEELGLAGQAQILATDISRAQLARARLATYGAWSIRGDGARLVGRYLRRTGDRFQLAERFRRRVKFAYLNLAQDSYPSDVTKTSGMDLVLCRNVFIYLDTKTVSAIARRLYDSLAAGGFLITGASDPLLTEHAPFEILTTPAGAIYRRPLLPEPRILPSPPASAGSPMPAALVQASEPCSPTVPAMDTLAEAREALAQSDGKQVVELTNPPTADVAATVLRVRALANLSDVETAAATAADAAARHPVSIEMGFLHATLLMNLDRYAEAASTLRRVLYLDPSLAIAQFALGATLCRLGNFGGAARAYRNARDLAARHSPEEILTLSDGERAGRLAAAAATQMAKFERLAEPA
jgi:chemotaxis protein methyltransferase CheR